MKSSAVPMLLCCSLFAGGWFGGRYLGRVPIEQSADLKVATALPSAQSLSEASSAFGTSAPSTGTDVRGAIAQALKTQHHYAKLSAIYDVLEGAASSEFPAEIAAMIERNENSLVIGQVVAYWIERDSVAARAWIQREGGKASFYFQPVAETWARVDPTSMMAWLREIPPADYERCKYDVRRALLRSFAPFAPAQAAEWVLMLPVASNTEVSGPAEFFGIWAKSDPTAAAARALSLPAGKTRTEIIPYVVSAWTNSDPQAAAAWIEALDDESLRKQALSRFVETRASSDPEAALAWLADSGRTGEAGLQATIARSWARKDEASALAWARSLPPGLERESALGGVIMSAEWNDPRHALDLWNTELGLAAGEERAKNMLSSILRSLKQREGFEAALTIAEQLPEQIATTVGHDVVLSAFLEFGPTEQIEVLMRQPASTARAQWVEDIVSQASLYENLRPDLEEGIRGLPTGAERDRAMAAMVRERLKQKPDEGLDLALRLSEADGRRIWLEQIRQLITRGGSSIERWLETAPRLTPEEKQQLRALPRNIPTPLIQ